MQVVNHFIGGQYDGDSSDSDSSQDERVSGFWDRGRLRGLSVGMSHSQCMF